MSKIKKKDVLLTEKEIKQLEKAVMDSDTKYGGIVGAMAFPEILCKFAARKLLRVLKTPCTEHRAWQMNYYRNDRLISVHYESGMCPECMAEIEQLLGEKP